MPAHFGRAVRARCSFFAAFLKRPELVASVLPSSRYLERRVVSLARVGRATSVVELGPGMGGTTRAILGALPRSARLLAIEITPEFARNLREWPDPRLVVHEGDAANLSRILELHGMPAPEVIISGIPFSALSKRDAQRLLERIHEVLPPGGRFIAYQLRNDIEKLSRPLFGVPQVVREFRNIPPLRVYRWRKQASARRAHVAFPALEALPQAGGVGGA